MSLVNAPVARVLDVSFKLSHSSPYFLPLKYGYFFPDEHLSKLLYITKKILSSNEKGSLKNILVPLFFTVKKNAFLPPENLTLFSYLTGNFGENARM